jgi:hypothetical protein
LKYVFVVFIPGVTVMNRLATPSYGNDAYRPSP